MSGVVVRPVLVAAGGTGGHVMPALAVADELRLRDVPVVWVGTRAGLEARLVPAAGIELRWITVAGLRGKTLVGAITGPLKLLLGCLQSMLLMARLKPRAVLGMGGFVSGPVGLAALLTRRPLVLHEQNAVAGMTNRHLSRFATRVFCAMPGVFPGRTDAQAVGNPVRRSLLDQAARPARAVPGQAALSILIVGGSRGAHALNTVVPEAVAAFGRPCRVLHQCGGNDLEAVRGVYARQSHVEHADVRAFIDDMPAAYAAADLVICRSGAMTVTELSAMGAAALLVPFPHAVDDHQTRNAEYLSDAGAGELLPQSTLTAETLAARLSHYDTARDALQEMGKRARTLFQPDAAEVVAGALAGGRR